MNGPTSGPSNQFSRERMITTIVFVALSFGNTVVSNVWAEPVDGCPRTVYFTTGDHQDLLWVPLDSSGSIDAAFTTLRDCYQVERIWWRGGQDEVWARQFVFRPENRLYDLIWQWWRHLAFEKIGTNRLAVETARQQGLKIWMAYGLFDNGSAADVGFSGFPYAAEDRLRIDHPECAPVNRFGTWRQGGPIEFAYPEARRGMVEYLAKYTVEAGYDGLAFLTYAENFSQRYDDEFGFNPLIVEEFQKRHGVDIRTQSFDPRALSKLRGEYLTQFFRELRTALGKDGPQIAVCVDGIDPELPARWSHNGARTAGLFHMDVATWAKEGLVDEVNVWAAPDDEAKALIRCQELCRGTKTVASAFRTRGQLPTGTQRVMFLGADMESGFDWENYVNYDDEKIPAQPPDALQSKDPYARRRLLTAVLKKKQTLPVAAQIQAVQDPDLYVRRLALLALAASGDAAGAPVALAALQDPEHSVRWQAALAVGELAGAKSIEPLFEAIARDPTSYQMRFHAVPETLQKLQQSGRLSAADKQPIILRLSDGDAVVREAALYTFLRIGAPATTEVERALLKIIADDPSPYAREMALVNLRSSFGPTDAVLKAIRQAMRDQDDAVQVRALAALAQLQKGPDVKPGERAQAIAEATAFFRLYGRDCQRSDKDWGWRIAGEALRSFGTDGKRALETMMEDRSDLRLAELAWRAVFVPQGDTYIPSSLEEDQAAHARYPLFQKTE